MTDMLEYSKNQKIKQTLTDDEYKPMYVMFMSRPFWGSKSYMGGPAQFGYVLRANLGVFGKIELADPIDACGTELKQKNLYNKILIAKRGNCIFVEKARLAQNAGAIGLIIGY